MTTKTCQVVNCTADVASRGMCGRHRQRIARYGELFPVSRRSNIELYFWSLVKIPATPDSCWNWTGPLDGSGYGRAVARQLSPTNTKMAHRWVYEQRVGTIPDGMVIDHLCRNRSCVNPEHLEPVLSAENTRRGLHGELRIRCAHGHELSAENTYVRKSDGSRRCRRCAAVQTRASRQVNGGQAAPWARTRCPQNHAYTAGNTRINKRGARVCRQCERDRRRAATVRSEHRSIGYGGAA